MELCSFTASCIEAMWQFYNDPYNKVTGCVSVCLYRMISLTAELIGFYLTGQLLIGPGKDYNYFGGGYHHPPKRNRPQKKINTPQKKLFSLTRMINWVIKFDSPLLKCPQRPLGAQLLILYNCIFYILYLEIKVLLIMF